MTKLWPNVHYLSNESDIKVNSELRFISHSIFFSLYWFEKFYVFFILSMVKLEL